MNHLILDKREVIYVGVCFFLMAWMNFSCGCRCGYGCG